MNVISTQAPAIDKATRIFHFIAENGGSTYTQIYQGLSLPQSSTSTLLASLIANGLLRQNEGRYFLGLMFYEFGNKSVEQFNIRELAIEPLTQLRDKTQLACHLGILDGNSAIYLAKVDSPNAILVKSWLGKRLSLHCSGLGKVLLAWLPDEQIDQLLPDEDLPAHTQTTITTRSSFKAELKKVRENGWAFDNGEDFEGITCIAVPVFDHNGKVIAAISTSGVVFQMPKDKICDFAKYAIEAATKLSKKIR
ncbi:IclR family transcriptional regulator [Orbus hercynius]|uniref:IclR family transcriptional regulator n=1 Tax=Orbus hercynius TaxID=593135 RepID=A0A495RJS4_9GAMM|nr:IclR family transcriptional regulator [Orbus hercynius]RKS87793.1 IclR family transcriptional regulator [Orbus hercynius]